jgi:hypothetical protein
LFHKVFTLTEANRTLPLVRRVVQDIMSVYPEWKDLVARYELVAAQARPDWGESKEQLDLKIQIDTVAARINGFLAELEQIGCEFKGLRPWTRRFPRAPGRARDSVVLEIW